ncbi:dihydroorotase [Paenisporosarcina cavernae]|uniref:Dihydroorotase n=1 Tax=Paenisporosarcina cavernae TaxID=2320858 RepID=A0A385YRR3_9BACL|nr:dihydroorotase [Paenisporosarcina cavernae]AYC29181.1 dihydroorotase [Paenisporosarcina cavernae]
MKTYIHNIQLLVNGKLEHDCSLLIENGVIQAVNPASVEENAPKLDGKGMFVSPGFVDVHVHLREPGGERKETIETGTLAAAKGGFTTICAMPNTKPVPDSEEHLYDLQLKIRENAYVRVLPYASITVRQAGKELVDFEALKKLGAFAFTDDGVGVQQADRMLQAMTEAARVEMPIVAHCEENTLVFQGVMHEGKRNKELDLSGIPSISECVQIARDVLLAEATGVHYHVCHVSSKESVRVIRDAKAAGIRVTAEVSPHHLLLTEEDIPSNDANWKMNPPLRGKEDQLALIQGLEEGTLDFIATDHAPHMAEEKSHGMEKAPFGIVGLETAFPLLHDAFVKTGKWTLQQLINYLAIKPAEVFGMPYGKVEQGAVADLVFLDLTKERAIDAETFLSKGRNTPFQGRTCTGWPVKTMVAGEIVWQEENA